MCLILFANGVRSDTPLLLAANRDEYFDRQAAPAAFWKEPEGMLAGRDLEAGGTWLGITRAGRFAAITNYRDPASRKMEAPSRGGLVTGFLSGGMAPEQYLRSIVPGAQRYNGFSMIAGDAAGLWFFSNREGRVNRVVPGVHGLSNHLLDTPWPKVEKGKSAFAKLLDRGFDLEAYFRMLADNSTAQDDLLPETGMGLEWERRLSPIRVQAGDYGTRCSTVLRVTADGWAELHERSFDRRGITTANVSYRFEIDRDRATSPHGESRLPGIPRPAP